MAIAANNPMIDTTIIISTSVNPFTCFVLFFIILPSSPRAFPDFPVWLLPSRSWSTALQCMNPSDPTIGGRAGNGPRNSPGPRSKMLARHCCKYCSLSSLNGFNLPLAFNRELVHHVNSAPPNWQIMRVTTRNTAGRSATSPSTLDVFPFLLSFRHWEPARCPLDCYLIFRLAPRAL